MRTDHRLALAVVVFALAAGLPLLAQQPPRPQNAIEPLQIKDVLSDEDRAALRAWIEERVQAIAGGDPDNPSVSAKAVLELRKNHTGAAGFKEAYAATCAEVVASAYKGAGRDSAARLIAVLNTLKDASSHRLLIEALQDKRVPVRTAAVIGLTNLQGKLVRAGGSLFADTITALREAGKRETSTIALQLIYRALDYTTLDSPPDPKANAAALLELLVARGEQYGAGGVKAEGADRPGLRLAGKLAGQFGEDERRRLVVATAKMLHYAVTRYTSELYKVSDASSSPLQIALRNRIELFIATAEELLAQLTNPPGKRPTVTKEMQERAVDERVTYMKIQMKGWADLLQPIYQVDVHMDVTEESADDGAGEETPQP